MGCAFCASALHGLVRDLTAGEMLSQVYEAERATGEKINHIVVMGMGEPFDNYENLKRFLELLHHQDGKNLSYRHMTVSTSGILPGIRQFAEDFPQVNLAVSLHRAEEKGRSEIMPVNLSLIHISSMQKRFLHIAIRKYDFVEKRARKACERKPEKCESGKKKNLSTVAPVNRCFCPM